MIIPVEEDDLVLEEEDESLEEDAVLLIPPVDIEALGTEMEDVE